MRFRRIGFSLLFVLSAVGIALGIIAYKTGIIIRYDSDRTFHSPIFSSEGSTVYFLSRSASGISWGPGIEFFTPPAKVIFLSDRFSLMALDISTKKTKILYTWDIPHEKGSRDEYRNRLFGIPGTELTRRGRRIYFKIGLDVRRDKPNSRVNEWLTGYYDIDFRCAVETKKWEQSYETPDQWPEDIVSGDDEVINYKNKAVLLREGTTGRLDILTAADAFGQETIRNIPIEDYSHRKEIERVRTLRETDRRLVEKFSAEGLSEGEAMLRAGDELEKMGLYPKSPGITATGVANPAVDHAAFQISRDEFRYGLFPDIEKAIKETGTEVRFWGNYISHKDYDTSRRINGYLAQGNAQFYVVTGGKTYLITITR